MSAESEFYLGSKSNVYKIETFEFSHPSLSKTYRIVRNCPGGKTLTLESGTSATFDYYPCLIKKKGMDRSLDSGLSITIGDVGDAIAKELDRIESENTFQTKPLIVYRCYRSDVLTAPLVGPIPLEITAVSSSFEGTTFEAVAPRMNVSATGEFYTIARFPALRGCL